MNFLKQNKKKILLCIFVIILIISSVLITKYVCTDKNNNLRRISKWGTSWDVDPDKDGSDTMVTFSETDNNLMIRYKAYFDSPQPGTTKVFDIYDVSGTNTVDIGLDYEGLIIFPDNSFVVDGHFNCPLVFYVGVDTETGEQITINGADYIDKKDRLQTDLNMSFDKADINRIPHNTNINDLLTRQLEAGGTLKWEMPKDVSDKVLAQNNKIEFDISLLVKNIEDDYR